jgi:LytS/YehU family sensor histidine kinase
MIHRLSDFFRTTLEKSPDHLVPLESELELVENYLAIEQVRFKDRLQVHRDIDPRTLGVTVPAMLLQPLVENSLRHGINALERPGVITIRSRLLADRLLLEVRDNGAGCADGQRESPGGIGLANVTERLRQIYGDDYVFRFDAVPDRGVVVAIEIPVTLPVAHRHRDDEPQPGHQPVATLHPREA